MLTNGGDDGDIVLGIGWVEEGVEPPGPRGDLWGEVREELTEGGREGGREGRREVVSSLRLRILPMMVRTPNTRAEAAPTVMASVRKRNSNCCWVSLERM